MENFDTYIISNKNFNRIQIFSCQENVDNDNLSRCELGQNACSFFCRTSGFANGKCLTEKVIK